MEARAVEKKGQVQIDVPIPAGYIAFLENTAEQCTNPQTKHSREGMQGARHWVQRVDTPDRYVSTPNGRLRRFLDVW